jgi:hypothetical protein
LTPTCVAPKIAVLAAPSAEVAATVKAHLPALISATQGRGRLALEAATVAELASLAESVAVEVAETPGCLAEFGQEFVDKLRSMYTVEDSLEKTVEAARGVRAVLLEPQ